MQLSDGPSPAKCKEAPLDPEDWSLATRLIFRFAAWYLVLYTACGTSIPPAKVVVTLVHKQPDFLLGRRGMVWVHPFPPLKK